MAYHIKNSYQKLYLISKEIEKLLKVLCIISIIIPTACNAIDSTAIRPNRDIRPIKAAPFLLDQGTFHTDSDDIDILIKKCPELTAPSLISNIHQTQKDKTDLVLGLVNNTYLDKSDPNNYHIRGQAYMEVQGANRSWVEFNWQIWCQQN